MALTLSEIKIKPLKISKSRSFQVIILDVKANKNSFDGAILGRELKFWVKFACGNLPTTIINFDPKVSVLDSIKPYVDAKYDYTIVLLSATALLEHNDIEMIREYVTYKDIMLCKLPVGYVVNNKYILNTNSYMVDSVYTNNTDNFYIIENKKQYKYALEVLQDRINNFHLDNGVEIIKPNSVYIEPEVDIECGVTIYPNVSLKGSTRVGTKTIIKDNATITDSDIASRCFIGGANIDKSYIGESVCIASFCNIIDSKIGKGTIIEGNCDINKYSVGAEEKIKAGTHLGETNDSSSGAR
ncbi:MAG: hypothetical protein E7354_02925 [Clostridiales bacterium]|nr:hypothetical protein [Clostridiales bacterium]